MFRRYLPNGLLTNSKRCLIFHTPKQFCCRCLEVNPYKLHLLDEGPCTEAYISKEEATKYYTQMLTIRLLENISATLYKAKFIRGFCHLYSGQEAVAVGIKSAMQENDTVITSYRAHGWTYLSGVPPAGVLGELTGREIGCSKGKGGSMHMYGNRFYGGNGIVGGQVPLGAGLALYLKYTKSDGVNFTLYGDGASNQGQVFESFNLSKLLNLPIVFVCENNRYGMGTATQRSSMNTDYYTRGDVIPGVWVDGMDFLSVRNAAEFARDYTTKHGPLVMEMYTYRYSGHSMSDPGTSYRSREEIQSVRKKHDPIAHFKDQCLETGLLTEEEIKKIDNDVKKEVEAAAEKSKISKELPLEHLTFDIYSNAIVNAVRGPVGYNYKHKLTNKPKNK